MESSQCNIIYIFLTTLLGFDFINSLKSSDELKDMLGNDFYAELRKVCMQFYVSRNNSNNDERLKLIAEYKERLARIKYQVQFQDEIDLKKQLDVNEVKKIIITLKDPRLLTKEFFKQNVGTNENRVTQPDLFKEKLQQRKEFLLDEIGELSILQNPDEFLKLKADINIKIKELQQQTNYSIFCNEFINELEKKVDALEDKFEILDTIYKVRYLEFLPDCKLKLDKIEDKLIKLGIETEVINPVSNIDMLDCRILKGIFKTQAVNFDNLEMQISTDPKGLKVELFDGEALDKTYTAKVPEDSEVEIRKVKKTKVFA